jgi:hypothetical protein
MVFHREGAEKMIERRRTLGTRMLVLVWLMAIVCGALLQASFSEI